MAEPKAKAKDGKAVPVTTPLAPSVIEAAQPPAVPPEHLAGKITFTDSKFAGNWTRPFWWGRDMTNRGEALYDGIAIDGISDTAGRVVIAEQVNVNQAGAGGQLTLGGVRFECANGQTTKLLLVSDQNLSFSRTDNPHIHGMIAPNALKTALNSALQKAGLSTVVVIDEQAAGKPPVTIDFANGSPLAHLCNSPDINAVLSK